MTRDPGALARATFDVLIIGGGIHGLFAAWDAARRGFSVALVEQDDYGSGLSFNHQRTVHGGLRALETFRLAKTVEQLAERRYWTRLAPAFLRTLPFFVPTRHRERPSRLTLGIGLRLYDLLGHARNHGVPPNLHLPPSQTVGIDEARRLFPGLPEDGLTGGATWSDYQVIYPDRLNWLVASAARQAGATLVNHAEAVQGLRVGARLAGARILDRLTGDTYDVSARAVVLAAGPALGMLFDRFGMDDAAPPCVAAANLLVDRPARSTALAARGRSGRRLTAVPWGGLTLVGTFQSATTVRANAPWPLAVDAMLSEANDVFPWLSADRSSVRLVHRGLVPAWIEGDRADLLPESFIIRHALRGTAGAVSIVGVKFTTARLVARRAIDAVCEELGTGRRPADEGALPHAACWQPSDAVRQSIARLDLAPDTVDHLRDWYGSEMPEVLAHAEAHGLGARLAASAPTLEAEIAYAVDHADARRLADAVLRRTWLGATGDPGDAALSRAADIMQAKLGWTSEIRDREIAAVRERYAL